MTEPDPLPGIEDEVRRVLDGAAGEGITLRALGGLAIFLHAPADLPQGVRRSYKDIDFVTVRNGERGIPRFMEAIGYTANRQFNTLNAGRRLLFYDVPHDRQVDVFVGTFKMCHTIPITERLDVDPLTVPLAELLLTKLQIVHLNEKDQRDILALLVSHPIGDTDHDVINSARIAQLLSEDWGLWRTTKLNLERTHEALSEYRLSAEERRVIADRASQLWVNVEKAPKSRKWKLRDRIGDRKCWYDLPEEVS
jgi:DNA repair exonuclease SbcCD nuclease subunit